MKKSIVLFVLALLTGIGAQAQIVSVNTHTIRTLKQDKTAPEAIWLVRAGLSFNGFSGDHIDSEDRWGRKLGYDFSVGFNKPLAASNAYWGMELGLGSRGYALDEDGDTEEMLCHNLRVSPFIAGYKYTFSNGISLDAHLGVFASYDYAGKLKTDYDEEETDFGIGDWEDEYGIDWNRFDAGIRLGGGIWYKNLNLDVTWHKGFVKPFTWKSEYYEDETLKSTTTNVLLRLGIAF